MVRRSVVPIVSFASCSPAVGRRSTVSGSVMVTSCSVVIAAMSNAADHSHLTLQMVVEILQSVVSNCASRWWFVVVWHPPEVGVRMRVVSETAQLYGAV